MPFVRAIGRSNGQPIERHADRKRRWRSLTCYGRKRRQQDRPIAAPKGQMQHRKDSQLRSSPVEIKFAKVRGATEVHVYGTDRHAVRLSVHTNPYLVVATAARAADFVAFLFFCCGFRYTRKGIVRGNKRTGVGPIAGRGADSGTLPRASWARARYSPRRWIAMGGANGSSADEFLLSLRVVDVGDRVRK